MFLLFTHVHDLDFFFCHIPSLNTHKELLGAPEHGQTHINTALLYTDSEDRGIWLTVCYTTAYGWQRKMTQVQVFGPASGFWKEPFMRRMTLLWNGKFFVNSTLTLVWITGFQVGRRASGPFRICTGWTFRSWSKRASHISADWMSVKFLVGEIHNYCGTSCHEQT